MVSILKIQNKLILHQYPIKLFWFNYKFVYEYIDIVLFYKAPLINCFEMAIHFIE